MKIYLGSDHAGFEMKNQIKSYLEKEGYEVEDFGALSFDPKDDYPDFIKPVAQKISQNPDDDRGIILGRNGQGEAVTANRFRNVRAVVFYGGPGEMIKLSKEHDNSNILSLGARFLNEEEAIQAVKLWLETPFSGDERHIRRLSKIDN